MKNGLYANVNAKQERIKAGSNETMNKPGTKGAPTAKDFKEAAKTAKPTKMAVGGLTPKQTKKVGLVMGEFKDKVCIAVKVARLSPIPSKPLQLLCLKHLNLKRNNEHTRLSHTTTRHQCW